MDQVRFYYGKSIASLASALLTLAGLAGTSLGFDVIIILLPLPVLWKLQLNLKQKVSFDLVLSRLAILIIPGRVDLRICTRLLRDDHPNHPHIQRQKPQDIHRQ